jgi:hypothetical protein
LRLLIKVRNIFILRPIILLKVVWLHRRVEGLVKVLVSEKQHWALLNCEPKSDKTQATTKGTA